jgi:tRNA(Arg) A34 adenosine deaminase TadA
MPTPTPLPPPMLRAMELAWESFRAGSLGIGATITNGDSMLSTGRNRLFETDPGDDVLAGTSLAHAEMNALAKLPWAVHRGEPLHLWTTLQPCLQCLGAIRLANVPMVTSMAPDPFFRGVERASELNEFIASKWPTIVQRPVDEWAALALLLQSHVTTFWKTIPPGWNEALPTIGSLAADLVASGELLAMADAAAGASVADVAAALWSRLSICVPAGAALANDGN